MTEMMTEPKPANGDHALAVQASRMPMEIHDDSQFQNLLDSGRFSHLQRVASLFAACQLVPDHYRNNVPNCFIGLQMAFRMGIDPLMLMQNSFVVHGKPGIEAKLAIALVNSSGIFTDSLDYEIEGTDASKAPYRVRCFATRKSTNKMVIGPWVDWGIVKAEKWDDKPGSKWRTMPALMFQYRAAMFFARLHCPERLMGMQTVDELHESGGDNVVPAVSERGVKGLLTKIKNRSTERPLSDGQELVDPDTGEIIPQSDPAPTPSPQETPAAAVPAQPVTPTAGSSEDAMDPREAFLVQLQEACESAGLTNAKDAANRIKKWALKVGVVGKEHTASDGDKASLLAAIMARQGYFA